MGSQILFSNVLQDNTYWTPKPYDLVEIDFCIHSSGLPWLPGNQFEILHTHLELLPDRYENW